MRIRLGYVAIALSLPKVTSSSQLTFRRYNTFISDERKLDELKRVTRSNLKDLKKILKFNIENDIHFYRMTSRIIPLATHPDVNWDFRKYFKKEFSLIGDILNEYDMRIDTHPDHFNVLNSLREDVVEKTIKEFELHNNLFNDLNYDNGKMVIHIGSGQEGKSKSIERFEHNFNALPERISKRIMLENDDKLYTAKEVINLCKTLNIPMVLDIHHHRCNNNGEKLEEIFDDFLASWQGEFYCPKIHISSPKDGGVDRKHADYINPEEFIEFVEISKQYNKDIDVMIEAKQKDLALFKLINDIKILRNEWEWVDKTTLEI